MLSEDRTLLDILVNYPFLPLYLATVLASLWRFPKYYDTVLRGLPILLTYTLGTEVLGVMTREFDAYSIFLNDFFSNYNALIYNIYLLVFCLYFLFIYYEVIRWKWVRSTLAAGAVLLLVCAVINAYLQNFQFEMQLGSLILGGSLLIFGGLVYLNYRQTASRMLFLPTDILSWISVGTVVFFAGFIPISILRYQNLADKIPESPIIWNLLRILIFWMYGCFLIGFFRMRRFRPFLKPPEN